MSFALRIGGSNEFISNIDEYDTTCSPPGSAESVAGWTNPKILLFDKRIEAEHAGEIVERIEGFRVHVETIRAKSSFTVRSTDELLAKLVEENTEYNRLLDTRCSCCCEDEAIWNVFNRINSLRWTLNMRPLTFLRNAPELHPNG